MAKLTGALFSLQAAGSIADELTYQRGKSGAIVKHFARPSNPRTAAQEAVRAAMKSLTLLWRVLSAAQQEAWNEAAPRGVMTGYSFFLAHNYAQWFESSIYDAWPPGYEPEPWAGEVTTAAASDVTAESAQLNGELVALGGLSSVRVFFQYKITGAENWSETEKSAKYEPVLFNAELPGLEEETEYTFRAAAEGAEGVFIYGEPEVFETISGADYSVSGASDPAACNGGYNADGTFGGKTRYKHKSEDYWIWWSPALFNWNIAENNGGGAELFQRQNASITGAYVAIGGVGDVVVS